MKKILINETQYKELLSKVTASEDAPKLSEEKIEAMYQFYLGVYRTLKKNVIYVMDNFKNIAIEDIIEDGYGVITRYHDLLKSKIGDQIEDITYEVSQFDDYLIEDGSSEMRNKVIELAKSFTKLESASYGMEMILHQLEEIVSKNDDLGYGMENYMSKPIEI